MPLGRLYFTQVPSIFSLNMLETSLLYLLDIMMNCSFMYLHPLECHLVYYLVCHAFFALGLTSKFISKFERSSKFWFAVLQIFLHYLQPLPSKFAHLYGCSNVANMYDFYKKIIFLSKNQIKLCIQNKYLYSFSENLILWKKVHSVKILILLKQTHSVKDEFYFQFSFATNEQI